MSALKTPRPPRADALRNRELILSVARQAFAEEGSKVTLDDVVKRSGLGVGTLYRHFPTRDALVEAVYQAEVEKLAEAGREMAGQGEPFESLRQWLFLFIEFLGTKRTIKELMNSLTRGCPEAHASTTELIREVMGGLTARAESAGEIRLRDLDPLDLLRALTGVANSGAEENWAENARRMADVMLAGLRQRS